MSISLLDSIIDVKFSRRALVALGSEAVRAFKYGMEV